MGNGLTSVNTAEKSPGRDWPQQERESSNEGAAQARWNSAFNDASKAKDGQGADAEVRSVNVAPAQQVLSQPVAGVNMANTELYNVATGSPRLRDMHQNKYEDCSFIAAAAALVRDNPDAIKRMIQERPDGSYDVYFFVRHDTDRDSSVSGSNYSRVKVNVKREDFSPNNANMGKTAAIDSNGKQIIWPAVIEAGFAKMNGIFLQSESGYKRIRSWPGHALESLTGRDADSYNPGTSVGATKLGDLQNQFEAGRRIVVSTSRNLPEKSKYALYSDHAYTVTSIYTDKAGVRYVKLNNPWGREHPRSIPVSELSARILQ